MITFLTHRLHRSLAELENNLKIRVILLAACFAEMFMEIGYRFSE